MKSVSSGKTRGSHPYHRRKNKKKNKKKKYVKFPKRLEIQKKRHQSNHRTNQNLLYQHLLIVLCQMNNEKTIFMMIELQLQLRILELETKKRKIKISSYINPCLSSCFLQKLAILGYCLTHKIQRKWYINTCHDT